MIDRKKAHDFLGVYYPPPHGCLNLAADVLRSVFELPIPAEPADHIFELLRNRLTRVEAPLPGDVVLMRAPGWHVGVLLEKDLMIHAVQPGGTVCIEPFTGLRWRNRIRGFYRWPTN